jgi:serine/threonine protein kinase
MNEADMKPATPEQCPRCGAALPAGTLAGLCPACLLRQGAAADTATCPEARPFEPPMVEELARLFPQLEILGLLGKGGMGAVYKARQPALDRLVALKILPAQSGPDGGFAERFTREARALARLSHPNIVAVHEFGQVIEASAGGAPALPYFIMEFVDGVNLRQLQRSDRLSPREALQIVPQICDALQYAHDEGIVHRDIKPENILVDRKGRVKIADFGLAKIIKAGDASPRHPGDEARTAGPAFPTHLTAAGQVMGTPHYMAPEQVEHPQQVDHRADIFSLGVVFYEMLTGELPLGKFQPPSSKVQVDVRLDEVVLHALEKEPERRYQHVSQVKTDIQRISSTTLPPEQALEQPVEPPRLKKINCIPALALYCLTNTLLVAANARQFSGHTDYVLAPYALLTWVVAGVFWARLHYLCWKALPERFRATTPAQALGFLFIPLFNYYWFFISFPKLATGFNALKRERPELPIRNLRGVGIAYAITCVLTFTLALNHDGWACPIILADLVLALIFYAGITANANLATEAATPGRPVPRPATGLAWKLAALVTAVVLVNAVVAFIALRPAPPQPGKAANPAAKARSTKPGGPFIAKLPQGKVPAAVTAHPAPPPAAKPADAFRQYAVNKSWAEVRDEADPSTPEAAWASMLARFLRHDDPAAVINDTTVGVPKLPAGSYTLSVTPEQEAAMRHEQVRLVVFYRPDLAAVITSHLSNHVDIVSTGVMGRQDGSWKVLPSADLDQMPAEEAAVAQFKRAAARCWRDFQQLPDQSPSLTNQAASDLANGMGGALMQFQQIATQWMSRVPGLQIGTPMVLAPPPPATAPSAATNPPPQPSAAAPATPTAALADLWARYEVARQLLIISEQAKALNAIAVDAARLGDLTLASKAADEIQELTPHDEAIGMVARLLARNGNRTAALALAAKTRAVSAHDALLRELAGL